MVVGAISPLVSIRWRGAETSPRQIGKKLMYNTEEPHVPYRLLSDLGHLHAHRAITYDTSRNTGHGKLILQVLYTPRVNCFQTQDI